MDVGADDVTVSVTVAIRRLRAWSSSGVSKAAGLTRQRGAGQQGRERGQVAGRAPAEAGQHGEDRRPAVLRV